MDLHNLILKLQEIEKKDGGDLICCTYNMIVEDYCDTLCLQIVDDDY